MAQTPDFRPVSVHGGHSGDFCGHATGKLPDIVARYAELGFDWVCLTEHMPPRRTEMRPPEETAAGLTVKALHERFDRYFELGRQLQETYAGQLDIFLGFETEGYDGYADEVEALIQRHNPDMLVGSVHHMHGLLFDAGQADYDRAAEISGGIAQLYIDYFDRQLELIERFQPAVVGHFDLIRIFDPNYRTTLENPKVRDRALRNLERIKALGLVLDLNARALKKGASEPYISEPLMKFAIEQQVPMSLGDDSHGVDQVGLCLQEAVNILVSRGGSTAWTRPRLGAHP